MRIFLKKIFLVALFGMFLFFMLFHSKDTVYFAKQGLLIWFQTMIPTLLPFMILTSIAIQLNIHRVLIQLIQPFFQKIFQVNTDSIFCILFGSLCGFPMGARIVAQIYKQHYISREEGSYLLSFCNNIGPIYFTGIALDGIRTQYHMPALLGMYSIPLLYGIVMRYTCYRNMNITPIYSQQLSENGSFFEILDDSINSALNGITMLGGYMVFFNLCTCIPVHLLHHFSCKKSVYLFCNCFLEISSGIQNLIASGLADISRETMLLCMVMFGGISCLAQTISCIRDMRLPVLPYCIHKMIQSILFYIYIKIIYHVI